MFIFFSVHHWPLLLLSCPALELSVSNQETFQNFKAFPASPSYMG